MKRYHVHLRPLDIAVLGDGEGRSRRLRAILDRYDAIVVNARPAISGKFSRAEIRALRELVVENGGTSSLWDLSRQVEDADLRRRLMSLRQDESCALLEILER